MIESIDSINEQHSGKWVLLADCEEDENGTIISGRVVLSDENRANIVKQLPEHEDNVTLISFRYAGKISEGVCVFV